MQVSDSIQIAEGHSIEIGQSTWNESAISVRDRYVTRNGGFSPRSSSEIPLEDVEHIVHFLAEGNHLSSQVCARLIQVLSTSIERQLS